MSVNLKIYLTAWPLLVLSGCFTGVESTPKITSSDVKREHITVSDEQRFLSGIRPQAPSQWTEDKRFYVADPKIALVLSSEAPIDTMALVGTDLRLKGISSTVDVMGDTIAVVEMITVDHQPVYYRTQSSYRDAMRSSYLDIPFAIDRDIVDAVSAKIKGQQYFIISPMWYDPNGVKQVNGLRHIGVTVEDVLPGNALYPIRVVFKPNDSDALYSVYMTVGDRRTSTRNFDTLFAFTDPRVRYPNISDEDWQLITHSRVRIGMTPDECRLALGAPTTHGQRPTTAGMVEYWSYADGVYLVFEEGYLISYRH